MRKKPSMALHRSYIIVIGLLFLVKVNCEKPKNFGTDVIYDGRSLIIHGNRELLFSGSVHYPRIPVEEWEDVLDKCKEGGLNVIQTYSFWNMHEPIKGQFDFTGQNDIVRFMKLCADRGMWVTHRVGPFVQGEWNNGGYPYWLRKEPNITYRTDNPAFKKATEKWVTKIISIMKDNKLYANQGGPIILAQIENEYDHVRGAFREGAAERYIEWAGQLALRQNVGVPWIMCEQKDPPGPIINTCNGRHCGDTFKGPNDINKPLLWTENWTAQFRVFGDVPSQRSAEDIAFAVARWFSKNGSHTNYYMYHGGTNFGRSSAAFKTTRYYDEGPIDEYGLAREPKYGHLRDLHRALALSKKAIDNGRYGLQVFSPDLEARYYEKDNLCSAFLWNNKTHTPATVNFKGKDFTLPPKSISILPDCRTVVFNSHSIVAQHSAREFVKSEKANKGLKWEKTEEIFPTKSDIYSKTPMEQFHLAEDRSDYMWYKTTIELDNTDLPFRKSLQPVIQAFHLGHSLQAFVNGRYLGTNHGLHRAPTFTFKKNTLLKEGVNEILILSNTMGMPDSGSYMERRFAGLKFMELQGLGTGELDLSSNGWHHTIGLEGEKLEYFTEEGAKKAQWKPAKGVGEHLTWYKAHFDAPDGTDPVAIKMINMTKGMIWVNGRSIGRYWSSFLTTNNAPSQNEYRIPRSYLKPKDNLLVIFDEDGGNIDTVEIETVNRDVVCAYVSEDFPPNVMSWRRDAHEILTVDGSVPKVTASLKCPKNKVITKVHFASFGNAIGTCGYYLLGSCNSPTSQQIVEQKCLGKDSCTIPVDRKVFENKQACQGVPAMVLAVQVRCSIKI